MRVLKLIPLALIASIPLFVSAQKLPAVQQHSLRAPANIKVDGKATEWGNKFQANNHSTDIYYTLSNDNNNLYLVIQAVYPDVIRRIINGGITFTVNPSGKKKDLDAKSITYPAFGKDNQFITNFKNKPELVPGSAISVMRADSFMNANNKKMTDKSKWIKTSGMKDIDTLISVYNEDGIKAAALFDNRLVYTWELSVSLKLLNLPGNDVGKFAYHITINEVIEHGIEIRKSGSGEIMSINVSKGAQMGQAATDFWGEYTLAK